MCSFSVSVHNMQRRMKPVGKNQRKPMCNLPLWSKPFSLLESSGIKLYTGTWFENCETKTIQTRQQNSMQYTCRKVKQYKKTLPNPVNFRTFGSHHIWMFLSIGKKKRMDVFWIGQNLTKWKNTWILQHKFLFDSMRYCFLPL